MKGLKELLSETVSLPGNWAESIGKMFANFVDEIIRIILTTIIDVSWQVTLIIGLCAAILFIFGYKKAKTAIVLSPVVHIMIQIIGGAILGNFK